MEKEVRTVYVLYIIQIGDYKYYAEYKYVFVLSLYIRPHTHQFLPIIIKSQLYIPDDDDCLFILP